MKARPSSAFERPAVFLVGGFGDQLMALPAMRALGAIFPSGMEILLGEGMLSFFHRGLPAGEAIRVWWSDFDKRSIDVERITHRAPSCDLFLGLSPWASTSVLELARRM